MPRSVDHAERRATIIEGFVAVAARVGLHATTMRSVAAEAKVSLRLVQYYFTSKSGLMQAGLSYLEEQSNSRWSERIAASPVRPTWRTALETLFAEALPTDEASRVFQVLWTSYAVLAMTDEKMDGTTFVDGPNRLQKKIEAVLAKARSDGDLAETLDVSIEAATLLALVHGLGMAVLVGQQSPEAAMAVVRNHLQRLSCTPPASSE